MGHSNRIALVAGALVTGVGYVVLSLSPLLAPAVKSFVFDVTGNWLFGNPLEQAKLLGGLPGGFVAGYLARDTLDANNPNTAVKYAFYAVASGLGAAYVGTVLLTVVLYGSPHVIGVIPMFFIVAPFYLFGGAMAGLLGNKLCAVFAERSAPVVGRENG